MALPVFLRVRSAEEEEDFISSYALLHDTFTTDEGLASVSKSETFEDHTLNNQIDDSADWTDLAISSPDVQIRAGGISASQCARQITSQPGYYIWEEPGWVNADSFVYIVAFKAGLTGAIDELNSGLNWCWDPNIGVNFGEGYGARVDPTNITLKKYTAGVASTVGSAAAHGGISVGTVYGMKVTWTRSTGAMTAEVYEWASGPGTGTTASGTDTSYKSGYCGCQIYSGNEGVWVDGFSFDAVNQRIGIASPRTCEPGPGTLTAVDTGNNFAISNGELIATGSAGTGDPGVYGDLSGSITARSTGLAVYSKYRIAASGRIQSALDAEWDTTPLDFCCWYDNDKTVTCYTGVGVIGAVGAYNTYQKHVGVLRPVGAFHILDGKLRWVSDTNGNGYPDTVIFSTRSSASDTRLAEFAALPLSSYDSSWGGDWTEVLETQNPVVHNSQHTISTTGTHYNFTVTVEDTKYVRVWIRYVDGDDWLRLEINTARKPVIQQNDSTLYTGSALTDAQSYEVDLIVGNDSNGIARVWLYIDKVFLTRETPTSTVLGATGSTVQHDLASNDWVLTTYPWPKLGIADSRVLCPQTNDTQSQSLSSVVEVKNVTIPTSSNTFKLNFNKAGTKFLYFFIDSTGGCALYNYDGGLGTSILSGGAATVTDGDDLVFVIDGVACELFVNGTSIGSGNSAGGYTGTTWLVQDFSNGAACDHMAAFPRDVTELLPEGTY